MTEDQYEWRQVGSRWRLVNVTRQERRLKEKFVPRGSDSARFDADTARSLSIQTGRQITNLADLKRYCAENGSRVVERGDHVYEAAHSFDCPEAELVRRTKRETGSAGGEIPLDRMLRRR